MLADDGELSQESSKDSFIDKDDICAKIESLGGMVIEKYDEEIVSIFGKILSYGDISLNRLTCKPLVRI